MPGTFLDILRQISHLILIIAMKNGSEGSSKEMLLSEVHSLVSKLAEQIRSVVFLFPLSAAEVLLLGLVVNLFAAEK